MQLAANCGVTDVWFKTIAEIIRETKGFWFRYQLEQANFREVVYTLAAVNRDPKKPFPTKVKMWPIKEVDALSEESAKEKEDIGRALLDYYKEIGRI